MGKVSWNILRVRILELQRPPYFTNGETKAEAKRSAWFQVGDWLSISHYISQTTDSKPYSQFHIDVSSDGSPHFSGIFRSRCWCDIQDVQVTDFHPVQKPQFTLVIPLDSHFWASVYARVVLSIWASWTLSALVLMRAVLRDWILSIGWYGRLRIR